MDTPDADIPQPRAIFLWGHELTSPMGTVGQAAEWAAMAAYYYTETHHRAWRVLYALAVCDAAVGQARGVGEEELATAWETRWLALLQAAWQARMEEGIGESLAAVSRGALQ